MDSDNYGTHISRQQDKFRRADALERKRKDRKSRTAYHEAIAKPVERRVQSVTFRDLTED